jgi:hypothetical protein
MEHERLKEYGTGCLICGEDLFYSEIIAARTCFYCGVTKQSNASCRNGHCVCDACHNGTASNLIERYCSSVASASPVALAMTLMKNPTVKMHGPKHHFLVPAVLLAAFYNSPDAEKVDLAEKIREARIRAEAVRGGFCGILGACGSWPKAAAPAALSQTGTGSVSGNDADFSTGNPASRALEGTSHDLC